MVACISFFVGNKSITGGRGLEYERLSGTYE